MVVSRSVKISVRILVWGGLVIMVAPELIGNSMHQLGQGFGLMWEGSRDVAADHTKVYVHEQVVAPIARPFTHPIDTVKDIWNRLFH